MHLTPLSALAQRLVKSYKTILPHTALLTKEALACIQLPILNQVA